MSRRSIFRNQSRAVRRVLSSPPVRPVVPPTRRVIVPRGLWRRWLARWPRKWRRVGVVVWWLVVAWP